MSTVKIINDDIETDDNIHSNDWYVHKFGGTSVASAECIERCVSIIEDNLCSMTKKRSNVEIDDSTCSSNNNNNNNNGKRRLAIVVSAMGGKPKVTDLLLTTVKLAAKRDEDGVSRTLDQIYQKHKDAICQLGNNGRSSTPKKLSPSTVQNLLSSIEKDISDIKDILKTVSLMKWEASRISELISGYGELWCARILAEYLEARQSNGSQRNNNNSRTTVAESQVTSDTITTSSTRDSFTYVDARRVIVIDEEAIQNGVVCWDESFKKLCSLYSSERQSLSSSSSSVRTHLVMTGYVASNTDGVATTLQRDGSDYSAAILGKLLHAKSVTIWTDVDGVMSADPRRVPGAFVIPEVSFNEAMELAYFGAKVIHPKTMQPAITESIPIYIRNTFNEMFEGTRIFFTSTTTKEKDKCVCGFSSIDNMALINVEGSGLMGVPGVAKRLFGTLESVGVNVVLISQASSEHSVTFATLSAQAAMAKTAVEETFEKELKLNLISSIDVQSPCSIIAAVGDGMSHVTGVAGRFFSALGDAKINVLAISQGCSERNISAVVSTSDSTRALMAVHAAFRLSHTVVRIGIIVGTKMDAELGRSLLKLLEDQREKLMATFEIELQVTAVVSVGDKEETLVSTNGGPSMTLKEYDDVLGGGASQTTATRLIATGTEALEKLSECVLDDTAHTVIFDCTASETISKYHPEWLKQNIHVITANNTGLSGSLDLRREIEMAEMEHGKLSAKYLREVTVGGALPVITSLRDLLQSGDKIKRMDGIMSVSMSYIFHRVAPPPFYHKNLTFEAGMHEIGEGEMIYDLAAAAANHTGNDPLPRKVSLSQAVKEAIDMGLMEEDPLKDLDNEYTARCLMVLAKELGIADDYDVQTIQRNSDSFMVSSNSTEKMPIWNYNSGDKGSPRNYNDIVDQLNEQVERMVDEARKQNCVPRHVSSIDVSTGNIAVKIVNVPENHVFAVTPPSCECVRFFTERHRRFPFIIQGPSAGADSTASALLAELLRLMKTKVGVRSGALSRTRSSVRLA